MQNNNLEINGKGNSAGGVFEYVTISGLGHIEGDLECKKLEVNGSGNIEGRVIAEVLEINGKAKIEDKVKAIRAQINGMASIEGDLEIKDLQVNGSAKIEGKVKVDTMQVNGRTRVEGDIEGEYIEINGSVKQEGMLSAEEVNIRSCGCVFEEIGATKVVIEQESSVIMNIFRGFRSPTRVEVIEADEIKIEDTSVKKIHGQDVIIGPKCKVDKVEYSGTLEIHESSNVKETIKID